MMLRGREYLMVRKAALGRRLDGTGWEVGTN